MRFIALSMVFWSELLVSLFFLRFPKNKDIVITKPGKGNGVVTLDRKLYNNAIEEIISHTSKL